MAPIITTRTMKVDLGGAGPAMLYVWIYFNLVANTILLPILVGTFLFSSRIKRHPTLVNLCVTWIFSGIFSLLLFYVKQYVGPEPNQSICIAQASLLFGITPMWTVAILMLFYYLTVIVSRGPNNPFGKYKLTFMLASPYIAQCAFTVAALFVAINNPESVSRDFRILYCALDFPKLSWAMSSFTLIIYVIIVSLSVYLGMLAYRNHRVLRNAARSEAVDIQSMLRVFVFGGIVVFGMIVNLISMIDRDSVVPDIFTAIAGAAIFLVFGTQADVLHVWCFWLPKLQRPEVAEDVDETVLIWMTLRNALETKSPGNKAPLNEFNDGDQTPLPTPRVHRQYEKIESARLSSSNCEPSRHEIVKPVLSESYSDDE